MYIQDGTLGFFIAGSAQEVKRLVSQSFGNLHVLNLAISVGKLSGAFLR